jgi:hypothetical protein
MSDDQQKLDDAAAAFNDGLSTVEKETADLKAQPKATALDFTGLDATVGRLKADAPAAPAAPVAGAPTNTGVAAGDPTAVPVVTAPINPVNGLPATTMVAPAGAALVVDPVTGATVAAPTQGINPPLATAPVVDPNVPAGTVPSVDAPTVVNTAPDQAPGTTA